MAEKKRRKGLGRGLSALLDDAGGTVADVQKPHETKSGQQISTLPIEHVQPNPDQPRRSFPPAEMQDLANSIAEKGILQPLLLKPYPSKEGAYTIVAGERRWRAAQMAQLHEVPVIIRDFSDDETLEIAIIENVQRADLNAVEEALGYQQLIDKFGHNQTALAKVIGKSRPYIANALRLLSLPDYVTDLITKGLISAGHARALITATNPSALARKVVEEGLSVRQTEVLAKKVSDPQKPNQRTVARKDADTKALEADLSAALSAKVAITHKNSGQGTVTIKYKSLEELDGLCRLMMQ